MTGYKIAIRNDNENVLSLIMLTKQESNSLQVIGRLYWPDEQFVFPGLRTNLGAKVP